jgi:acyl-coenzyme A thioesterase PaaI-like protein
MMILMVTLAVQDQMRGNYCWGCGADNPVGLHLKSYWDGAFAVAQWIPADEFAAGPRHFLNGGIIATLLDCHGVCTAVADAYQRAEREIHSQPEIWHATVSLTVEYLRPTPIDQKIELKAHVLTHDANNASVECVLSSGGKDRARATVTTRQVPDQWRHGASRPATR